MINVADLKVTLNGRALVDAMTFTAKEGQTIALVGASGSGKTTTGLALLGQLPPGSEMSGRIAIDGRWPPRRGDVAYLPQHPSTVLNPVRRIGSVLRELSRLHGTSVPGVLAAASLPADTEFLRRFPHQLSGGQQQRLAFAQILLAAPKVLVADEPTTGQDPRTRAELTATFAALPITTIVLSHDLDLVRRLADHVIVLRGGRVQEAGPDILGRPRSDYARALVEAARPVENPVAAERPGPPILTVRDLTAAYQGPVLRGIDLDMAAGERLAIVGSSGSGKTTLARCLAGLHRPTAGTIALHGQRLSLRRNRAELARVQYIFQDPRATFAPGGRILDQVARTAVRLRGLPTAVAAREAGVLLENMGLPAETSGRPARTLSGGELQRAGIARAVLADPDVLICDEITSALDPLTQADILDLVTGLRTTLILITHDPIVVARSAQRVIALKEGRALQERGRRPAGVADRRQPRGG
ncbi:peptide/nickel transport system ATP-binding protein [Actinocorallia herbida]|uniref:Peptide/nickel transport system ATP-binding protein n=1 Tax=Actinocorallia herbida TaxID=58109 RepID=A0A3N1D2F1_9ACTN|nr:ATP-binding cassette domain-containing protein [Actinocorallia herbida]ROO87701.1 peptide/nickel transport system ATP-binding protein [Actinocorallia herbida]